MTLLTILTTPDSRLKKKAMPVTTVDDAICTLMNDMLDTMYDAHGIGLAAPQVGVDLRVLVMDISEGDRAPLCMVNPEIIQISDENITYEEGCLSVPDHYAHVARPSAVRVRYLDHQNELREMDADGLLSICVQHEIDHLNGVLFIDHLTSLKRNMIICKLQKAKKKRRDI